MKLNNTIELTYLNGYYVVREYRLKKGSTTDYGNGIDYTFAKLTGAVRKLKALGLDISQIENLEDKLKLEAGIEDAKKGNAIKSRKKQGGKK